MKLYAVAITAYKFVANNTRAEVGAAAVLAVDDTAAMGRGIELAKREWPIDQGWGGHGAAVCEIGPDLIERAGK